MDGGVIATATELFDGRHYPGVVAMCADALEAEPDCVPLRVIRARAHIALRRDLDAQADLRDLIRLDPQCGIAYRLLGELAARRDENESASIFFREALRLDPDDHDAFTWLEIVEASVRPAAGANKLPAPASAAGRFPVTRAPVTRARTGTDLHQRADRTVPGNQPRFARGTHAPADLDERPTKPFARGSDRNGNLWKTPTPTTVPSPRHALATPAQVTVAIRPPAPTPTPLPLPPAPNQLATAKVTMPGRPASQPPAPPTQVPSPPIARGPMPELAGFGEYLVSTGILSRERLRAAQAYQRSMKVQLSTAIVTLGLATPQRIEWAAVSHQSHVARARQPHQP